MENIETTLPIEKPQALKTLCILTFVGCGLMFLLSLLNIPNILKSNERKAQEIEQIRGFSAEMADQLEAQYMAPNYTRNMIIKLIVDVIFLVATLIGAIMMWNLKKQGFYIYAASEILYYFSGYLSGQGDPSKILNTLPATMKNIAYVIFVLMIIQDLLFIFLYWRQTKYMR